MLTHRTGDAVQALQAGAIQCLGHQVNLQGTMGAGIARQIARTWPAVVPPYRTALRDHSLTLGGVQYVSVGPQRWIANIAGQTTIRRVGRATEYAALAQGLHTWAAFLQAHNITGGLPYGIGCGLAGGEWAQVLPMIEAIAQTASVYLYHWNPRDSAH